MGRTSNKKILQLAEQTYSQGINPVQHINYEMVNNKIVSCCVLGAACVALTNNNKIMHDFDVVLGRSKSFIMGVQWGFDGKPNVSNAKTVLSGYKLGETARKKFLK